MLRLLLVISILCLCETITAQPDARILGNKSFEVSNHLGNVMAVLSDRKTPLPEASLTTIAFTETDIKSFKDYYPYGMLLDNRNDNTEYRYGFQGQEKDDEVKGANNSINYKYRVHDPRLGRFFAVDPITAKYPYYSSYQFSGNKTIQFVELEGLEEGESKINSNGAFDNEAISATAFSSNSTSDRINGSSINYKKNYFKNKLAINVNTTTSLFTLKNGIQEVGITNNTSFSIGYKFNNNLTLSYGIQLRLSTGHFSKSSNIVGFLAANWRYNNMRHSILVGNDYFSRLGYNGETSKFTSATDGGLTMNFNYTAFNDYKGYGWSIAAWGYTAHRQYNDNKKGDKIEGDSGFGQGVYKTDMYKGAFNSVAKASYIRAMGSNIELSIGAGLQGKVVGQSGQNFIHKYLNLGGEFKGWNNLLNAPYLEIGFSFKIK